jgi:hypothetical protein
MLLPLELKFAKLLALSIIFVSGSFCSPADSFRLEGLKGAAYLPSTNIETVWRATNDLPRQLWVYQVVPQNFSMAVISNLLQISGFSWKNLTKRPDPYVEDKKLLRFVNDKQNWTRYLEIAPTLGWVEYYAGSQAKPPFEGVPSEEETKSLAMDVLFQLGIDRSLLKEGRRLEGIQGSLSRDGQKLTTNVVSRGVSFGRKIDGIESRNSGCFSIDFETHARITKFSLSWRNLQPYRACPVATPDEIMNFIKTGQTILPVQSYDWTGADHAEKLTIVEATPIYFDREGDKSLDFVYPYVGLIVEANLENSKRATFYLECPILSTNLAKP